MYKVIGADGKEYGPVSLEQLKQWLAEGRVNAQTRVQQAGRADWQPAVEMPEIGALLAPPLPAQSFSPAGAPPPIEAGEVAPHPQKGLAMTSFVLGVSSFALCLGVVTGIPAIICGHIARNRATRSPAEFGGGGLAVAGLLLGYLSILYTLVIAGLLLPLITDSKSDAKLTMCTSHMRQIGLALRVWGVDHGNQFPFNVSTNAGGTLELCRPGPSGFDENAHAHFALLSQELGKAAILVCPADSSKHAASDFERLGEQNVSYRLQTGREVTDTNFAEVLLKCPLHGTVLRCDGNVEYSKQSRRLGL